MNQQAFDRFNSIRGIVGGASLLTQSLISSIQEEYPALLPLVTQPSRFLNEYSPWMSVGSKAIPDQDISIEVVESKLTFCAAYLPISKNKSVNRFTRLFVLNASFMALTQHFVATANNQGLTVCELRELIFEMKVDGERLRYGQHASHDNLSQFIPGVAFVLAHELAHAVGGSHFMQPPHSEVPSWCLEQVKNETNADLCAIAMLLWSIDSSSNSPEQKKQQRINLFKGINLLLLGMRALDVVNGKERAGVYDDNPMYSSGIPKPSYRAKQIEEFKNELISLDMLSIDDCESTYLLNVWLELETNLMEKNSD